MSSGDIAELQSTIGYAFKDEAVLMEALTHKSYHHEHPRRAPRFNERLEFLGDSVLGMVVAAYLFSAPGELDEAGMSRVKSHIVRGKVLAGVAADISLGKYLRLGRGEEESGGRQKASLLANAAEALIGAVFVDGGYRQARRVTLGLLRKKLDAAVASGRVSDYKSELQELCQVRFGKLPEYRLVAQEGQAHKAVFTVEALVNGRSYGRGKGGTKKEAQSWAAREALEKLRHPIE